MSIKIGSHISNSAPHYLVGALKETLANQANAMMFYSGPPQNTKRVDVERFKIAEFNQLIDQSGFDRENIILHAPYIINLANCVKPSVFELAVDFLIQEIQRAITLGVKVIVLHPGSAVEVTPLEGMNQIVKGLDMVFDRIDPQECVIALETMAGKGREVGRTFEELAYIIQHVKKNQYLGVCLDTCHIHDAGYDLGQFDKVLDEFDQVIGLDRLKVIHVNDSKNEMGAKKDRHENIGFGKIGFDKLINVLYHPRLNHLVKILETPWVEGKSPYKLEIEMIKNQVFDDKIIKRLLDESE